MKFLQFVLVIAICWLPNALQAGGIFLYEVSSADTRLASAGWSARANDPSTLFTNPAGMTRLCRQMEFGTQAIFNKVQFDPNASTTVSGKKGHADIWLPSGSFYYVHPHNECLTFGLGSLGYFGADLVYNHSWVGRYYVQKIMTEGFSLVPAVAYRYNDALSFGAGLNVMYGVLKQRAAVNNALDGLPDGYFTLHDYKFGFGGVFGILYELDACTRFGVQYLTEVRLNFRDRPNFKNIGPILTTILNFTGIDGSSLNLNLRVPQSVIISAYHALNPCWSVMADLGWQQWSRFQRVTISLANADGSNFRFNPHYKDTWHAAIGTEWYYSDSLTFSGGVAYDSSAVSNKNRPLDFPIGKQWRFGAGARWYLMDNLNVDFCSELLWSGNLKADVSRGSLGGRVSGKFKDCYGIFTNVNLTWTF